MAEHFRFFDSANPLEPDRTYNAQEFTDYFRALVTTGVMKGTGNQLKVTTTGANMVSSIDTGIAFLLGRYYENDSLQALLHETEAIGKDRIDRIVIRMDLSTEARNVKAFIKKGAPGTVPVAPPLTQTVELYEISLAQVLVKGGQTYINTNAVTDERGKDVICPWAGSKILPNFDDTSIGQPGGIAMLGPDGLLALDQRPPFPTIYDASTSQKGIVKLNDSLLSASTTEAATTNAVKQVNDKLIDVNTALGGGSSVSGTASVAIGFNANSSGLGSIALGAYANAPNNFEGVLGTNTAGSGPSAWKVPGSFSVAGTKNFEIPHPAPHKNDTHIIRHGAVESPTAGDTLYRYTIESFAEGDTVELKLPDYFEYLNKDVDIFVSPHLHFGRAFGIVEGDILKVTCEKAGTYKALVIGTRNDNHESVQTWNIKGVEREINESWTGEKLLNAKI